MKRMTGEGIPRWGHHGQGMEVVGEDGLLGDSYTWRVSRDEDREACRSHCGSLVVVCGKPKKS